MTWTDITRVELFHLHLLRLLATGPAKSHIALKGGSNLRFFFESVRCSEDMDLDVAPQLEPHVLRDKVDGLLGGKALAAALAAANLEITRVSAPKQTDTTQRWKIGLRARDRGGIPLHTKVEFSRRRTEERGILEPVSSEVLGRYGLLPLLVVHYPLYAALRQKVGALVGRRVVQARDVFDLAVLLARAGTEAPAALAPLRDRLLEAGERAMDVSFEDFESQVVVFLDPAHAGMYESRSAWDALQAGVVEQLERAAT